MTRLNFLNELVPFIERLEQKGHSRVDIQDALHELADSLGDEFDITDRLLAMGRGADEISRERERQLASRMVSNAVDDEWVGGELVQAAVSYAGADGHDALRPKTWPLESWRWNPEDRRSNLIRAGALIAAELDRLDRSGQS